MQQIDFAGLAAYLLERADHLLPRWLQHGTERNGRWYVGDFDGGAGESANVSLSTGTWIDNAGGTEDRGGDLLSLYKRVFGYHTMRDAAVAAMAELGLRPNDAPAVVRGTAPVPGPTPAPETAAAEEPQTPAPDTAPRKRAERWRSVLPVPPHAPEPREFVFAFRNVVTDTWDEQRPSARWTYTFRGERFGWVARFDRIDSKGRPQKDVLQYTWCEDQQDDARSCKWRWKHWPAPRPLYVPAGDLAPDSRLVPALVVEGEKCALAGLQLLGGEFDTVSWPGGGKAWALARWEWLRGRVVYLWPDCDAQRKRLNAEEKAAGTDPTTKPVLPAHKQPGMATMVGIGQLLQAELGCMVFICQIPQPGAVADGWDLADAVAEGWDADKVRAFIRAAVPFVAPDDAARAAAEPLPMVTTAADGLAGASVDLAEHAWRAKLLKTSGGATTQARENFVLALDGLPTLKVPGLAEAAGVIGFNEFTNDVVKLKPTPWGTPAGAWVEVEDLLLGEWLVRQHWLPSAPRGTLEEAVRMVAHRHRFHPVREYLQGLRWDGVRRLATWLRRACLEPDEWDDADDLQRYLARVGTWFVQAMCARVMRPGVKFDYMLILEGAQGMRKSTLLRALAGDFFADTGLILGEKDSFQNLQGVWMYEIPELDAFSKADVQKIKAYVASEVDRFRASFDRRAANYPRQVVFAGTTNEDHYLTDPTGNRRFWPVRVTRFVDVDWVVEHRDQLFAEAMDRIQRGARMHPTPAEEIGLFVPQQQLRTVDNSIESAIARYLYPPDLPGVPAEGLLVYETTIVALLGKVGIGLEKLTPGRFHEKQAGAALRKLGWTEARSSEPGRSRVYRRPGSSTPGDINPRPTQGAKPGVQEDACPF